MRIMICDDNRTILRENVDTIHGVLNKMGLQAEVELYNDGRTLLGAFICAPNVDYIFMDIELPEADGLEISKRIRKMNADCRIILLTAYERYAIAGYEVDAYRYLMKPLQPDAVYKIFKKTWCEAENKYIALETSTQKVSVLKQNILYAETRIRKSAVVTGKATYLTPIKLNELEVMLGGGFLRCHQSFIVNLEHCVSMSVDSVTLSDRTEISVSRPYRQNARSVFLNILMKNNERANYDAANKKQI